jgi:hypothetical protein
VAGEAEHRFAGFRGIAQAPERPRDPIAQLQLVVRPPPDPDRADQPRLARRAPEEEDAGSPGSRSVAA